jgi:hypothetical protein
MTDVRVFDPATCCSSPEGVQRLLPRLRERSSPMC